MYESLYPQPRRGGVLRVVGWFLTVAAGIWLAWYGFTWTEEGGQSKDAAPTADSPTPTKMAVWPTATPLMPTPTLPPDLPTATPLSIATLEPTAIPATPTAANAFVTVGAQGVNVRGGPGTNYARLGHLDPNTQAELTGRYSDWWQIRHDGAPAWVFGELVTASNADSVPQVQPPPSPTAAPATAVPTAMPPTATSVPAANLRGLVPDKFEVEGAPGPYTVDQTIWFHMWITNKNSSPVEFKSLGVWVQETGAFQKSWTYSQLPANQQFYHKDQMHDKIASPGTYNLWMVIEFLDGESVLLAGPVVVTVQ